LQEVVDKWLYLWLYLIVPVMMSVIPRATYVIPIGMERYTILKVGQAISRMINGLRYYVLSWYLCARGSYSQNQPSLV
jgi:hypothetical protein